MAEGGGVELSTGTHTHTHFISFIYIFVQFGFKISRTIKDVSGTKSKKINNTNMVWQDNKCGKSV